MAQLPTADQLPTRQADPQSGVASYTPVQATAGAPGAGEELAGDAMQKFAADLQEKQDTTRVEDAWNQYKNAALETTVGPDGVLKKQSGDAVNGNLMGTVNDSLNTAR